jgi:hypothetical protein
VLRHWGTTLGQGMVPLGVAGEVPLAGDEPPEVTGDEAGTGTEVAWMEGVRVMVAVTGQMVVLTAIVSVTITGPVL